MVGQTIIVRKQKLKSKSKNIRGGSEIYPPKQMSQALDSELNCVLQNTMFKSTVFKS